MPLLPHTVVAGDWIQQTDDVYYPSSSTGGVPLFAFNLGILNGVPSPRNWRGTQVISTGGKLYLSWGRTFDELTIHEYDVSGVFLRQVCHFTNTGLDWSASRILVCDQTGRLFAFTGPNNSSLRPPTYHAWRITQDGLLDHDFIFAPIGFVAADGTIVQSNLYFGTAPGGNSHVDVSADGSRLYFAVAGTAFYVDESGTVGLFGDRTAMAPNGFSGHHVNVSSVAVEWLTGNIFLTYVVDDPAAGGTASFSTLRQVYSPALVGLSSESIQQRRTLAGGGSAIDDPTTFLFTTRAALPGTMWLAEKQSFFNSVTFQNDVKSTWSKLTSGGGKQQTYVEPLSPFSGFTAPFFVVYPAVPVYPGLERIKISDGSRVWFSESFP